MLDSTRFTFLLTLGTLALGAAGCADLDTPLGPIVRFQSRPEIASVSPATVTQGQPAILTVEGSGFLPGATAFVGNANRETLDFVLSEVEEVDWVSDELLRLKLPLELPRGRLSVTVINRDDGLATAPQALTVLGVNAPAVSPLETVP